MLYATTRNPQESFTPAWAIHEERAPDGGFFLPFRAPYFDFTTQKRFKEQSFLDTEAEILNSLFSCRLTGWDLMFGAGRTPACLVKIGRRTYAAQRWRNPGWTFSSYAEDVCRLMSTDSREPGPWLKIGVSAALLAAMIVSMQKQGILKSGDCLDVAVDGSDYLTYVSCLYLKAWAMPIGHVVCALHESKGLWSLIHDGEMQTDILEPDSDQVDSLEIMLAAERSQAEVKRFLNCVKRGRVYVPSETLLRHLRSDIGVAMISPQRIRDTIPAIYGTHQYLSGPEGAFAYGGLLDYRAVTGSANVGLVLMDRAPSLDLPFIGESLGLSRNQTREMLFK